MEKQKKWGKMREKKICLIPLSSLSWNTFLSDEILAVENACISVCVHWLCCVLEAACCPSVCFLLAMVENHHAVRLVSSTKSVSVSELGRLSWKTTAVSLLGCCQNTIWITHTNVLAALINFLASHTVCFAFPSQLDQQSFFLLQAIICRV